jgi:hypothetical protein
MPTFYCKVVSAFRRLSLSDFFTSVFVDSSFLTLLIMALYIELLKSEEYGA